MILMMRLVDVIFLQGHPGSLGVRGEPGLRGAPGAKVSQ